MALSSFLSYAYVRFTVVTVLCSKQTSNLFGAYNDHFSMNQFQLWFGYQEIFRFDTCKSNLVSSPLLLRYDSSNLVFLKTDWSATGIGYILRALKF